MKTYSREDLYHSPIVLIVHLLKNINSNVFLLRLIVHRVVGIVFCSRVEFIAKNYSRNKAPLDELNITVELRN